VPRSFLLGSPRSIATRESPLRHEQFHHGAVLELVLERVWVMRIGYFKKLLQVVFEWLSLPLEIMFGSHYEPLARVVSICPAAVVAGHYGKVTRLVLLRLLATFGAFPRAFNCALGGRDPAIASSCSCVTLDRGSPNYLLTRGMSGCDVKQIHGSSQLLTTKLMNQGAT
jgi:hypothetical protein